MAQRFGHPEWLAYDLAHLADELDEYRRDPGAQYWCYEMVALALLWHRPVPARVAAGTDERFWTGKGPMPVATYRWGDGLFLGVKGGSAGLSHSHMDVGSFVFEAGGVRWAVDPGMQDYESLEGAGVDLWNERAQDSQRWSVFRIGPESHNILRFEGMEQLLFRAGALDASTERCEVDAAAVYGPPIRSARRRFEVLLDGISIEDSWDAESEVVAIAQWLTTAQVEQDGQAIILHEGSRQLRIDVDSNVLGSIEVDDVSRPTRSYDAPNPGLMRIRFRSRPTISGHLKLRVALEALG